MVADAPPFAEVAATIHNLLKDRVFVAHNVNFDYSFIRHQLKAAGYTLDASKLCTVRASRRIFPGYKSYSLGSICAQLDIPVSDRHRAMGDAAATSLLFRKLLDNDSAGVIREMLKRGSREQYLPLQVSADAIDQLPNQAGVYYFQDQKQNILYIGKAKDLRKRVISHFSNNSTGRKKQELMRKVHRIDYALTGTEFTASILESVEIRKHWPVFNKSQKQIEFNFGIFLFEDQQGRKRLGIDRLRKTSRPVSRHPLQVQALETMWRLIRQHGLCPYLCFLQTDGPCTGSCDGACTGKLPIDRYNQKVEEAVTALQQEQPSFAIRLAGRHADEQTWMLMDDGVFYGLGFLPEQEEVTGKEQLKNLLTPYHTNEFVRAQLLRFAEAHPTKTIVFQQ
jgi:DNA polymerase-3 subunit epsilon